MENPPRRKPSLLGRLTNATLGTAFAAQDVVEKGFATAWELNQRAWKATEQIAEPLLDTLDTLGVTKVVRVRVETVTGHVETTVTQLEQRGRTGILEGAGFATQTIANVIDTVIAYLNDNPEVDTLIRAQVDKLLPMLSTHPAVVALVREQVSQILPELINSAEIQALIRAQAGLYLKYLEEQPEEVQALIREQGDIYIDYLNAHPTPVQTLVQGQSLSLASQVRDEARERTVTADSVIDTIVRNILRLKPREDLPVPSEKIQERAEVGRLPADYVQERKNGSD